MKKKTLAAASLLLALLMPLGITPLAVYADETQPGASNVSEVSEEMGETKQLKAGEIRVQTNDGFKIYDADNADKFREAMKEALPGSTIELGEGTYSLYKSSDDMTQQEKDAWIALMKEKTFTFVGQNPEKTVWRIGAEVYPGKSGEYNSDYSFQGSQSVTFKKMTLRVPYNENYLGFSHTNVTVVEDCVIEGRTAYWGYKSAMFKNTTFNAPSGDYAIWTYSSPEMTFDNCTFNASGKVINVYTDFGATQHDFTINFDSCTVNSTEANKTALSINDSLMTDYGCNHKFYVNIIGNNTIKGLKPDTKTCSRLFGFSNDKINIIDGKEYHYDSGSTVAKSKESLCGKGVFALLATTATILPLVLTTTAPVAAATTGIPMVTKMVKSIKFIVTGRTGRKMPMSRTYSTAQELSTRNVTIAPMTNLWTMKPKPKMRTCSIMT